jgi:hypothetical protein
MNELPFSLFKYHKRIMKKVWVKNGIIFVGLFDEIYDIYIHCAKCDECKTPFKNSKDRQLDHDHFITDDFNIRDILCRRCHNNKRKQKWHTNTGEEYITKLKNKRYKNGYFFTQKLL